MGLIDLLYSLAKYAAGCAVVGINLSLFGLWWYQGSIIYPAYMPQGSRTNVPKPSIVGLPFDDITLTTSDGVELKAYFIPARRNPRSTWELQGLYKSEQKAAMEKEVQDWEEEKLQPEAVKYAKSRPTILFFHANAGNMGHRIPLARKFNVDLRCNVFMLSYRGYGLSQGIPSEKGIYKDVKAALDYITKHELVRDTKLIAYGQSIGGAVCIHAASTYPDLISGLIIENTFLSLPAMIPTIPPFKSIPTISSYLLPLLLRDHWNAAPAVPRIPQEMPMLMISGKRDELVPPSQMRALRRIREDGKGKCWFLELDGAHNDTFLVPGYWEEIARWLHTEVDPSLRVQQNGAEKGDVKRSEGEKGSGNLSEDEGVLVEKEEDLENVS